VTLSEIGPYVRFIAVALDKKEGPVPVSSASPQITSDAVEQALKDAEQLIASRGATSGVDRVHTAFHGFLLAVCKKASIEELGGTIRESHSCSRRSANVILLLVVKQAGKRSCFGLPAPWQ
jgi:hypothetical protein